MIDEQRPALHVAARGIVMAHVQVRTAERTLHSGVYGGAALNAAHALSQMLAAVLPGPDGRDRVHPLQVGDNLMDRAVQAVEVEPVEADLPAAVVEVVVVCA